jgi:Zn-dependent protease with chaperone function
LPASTLRDAPRVPVDVASSVNSLSSRPSQVQIPAMPPAQPASAPSERLAFTPSITLRHSPAVALPYRVALSRNAIPSATAVTPVRFPGLRAARFQHPVDVRATRTLRAVPLLAPALRAALGVAESVMILDGLASGVKVSEAQMPSLFKTVKDACEVLDMPAPELYVKQNPMPNAYTLAVQGRRPFIVVHSSLLELLDEKEVAAVIGHECGHLKSEHGERRET